MKKFVFFIFTALLISSIVYGQKETSPCPTPPLKPGELRDLGGGRYGYKPHPSQLPDTKAFGEGYDKFKGGSGVNSRINNSAGNATNCAVVFSGVAASRWSNELKELEKQLYGYEGIKPFFFNLIGEPAIPRENDPVKRGKIAAKINELRKRIEDAEKKGPLTTIVYCYYDTKDFIKSLSK